MEAPKIVTQNHGNYGIGYPAFPSVKEKNKVLASYLDGSLVSSLYPCDIWQAASPISSESTESYPGSSLSRSPKDSEDSELAQPCQDPSLIHRPEMLFHTQSPPLYQRSCSNIPDSPSPLTSNLYTSPLLADSPPSNDLLTLHSDHNMADVPDSQVPSPATADCKECCLLGSSLPGDQEPTSHALSSGIISAIRPDSLNLMEKLECNFEDGRSRMIAQGMSTPGSASLNTPLGLEQQLSGADLAWMCTLDTLNVSMEEVDLILSPTRCLNSLDDTAILNPSPTASSEDRNCLWQSETNQLLLADTTTMQLFSDSQDGTLDNSDRLETSPNSGCDSGESVDNKLNLNSPGELSEPSMSLEQPFRQENHLGDSESTLTCSETEFHERRLAEETRPRARRRKVRSSKRRRVLDFYSYSQGGDVHEETDDEDRDQDSSPSCRHLHKSPYKTCNRCIAPSRCPSYRRIQNARADADLKPWWPDKVSLVEHLGDLATCSPGTSTALGVDKIAEATVDEGGQEPAPELRCKARSDRASPEREASSTHQWPSRRRRKQLELWQFILCRLETSKQSSFQWVNRATGVFRIVDTHCGAREWGRYRNNNRMDYEKMARAMRFYYKDSILRKARQQLHFQFAMPYVEWANTFYHRL